MFVKLINNQLDYAPNVLQTADGLVVNPTEQHYLAQGYKHLVNDVPSYNTETETIEFVGFTETENAINHEYCVKPFIREKTEIELLKEQQEAIMNVLDSILMGEV